MINGFNSKTVCLLCVNNKSKICPSFQLSRQHILHQCQKEGAAHGIQRHTMEYVPLVDLLQTLLQNTTLYRHVCSLNSRTAVH